MKRNRQRNSTLFAVAIVAAVLLTACGGGEDATDTPEPAAPEATEPPAPTMEPVAEFECTDEFGCVTVNAGENLRLATALVISGPNETLASTRSAVSRSPSTIGGRCWALTSSW